MTARAKKYLRLGAIGALPALIALIILLNYLSGQLERRIQRELSGQLTKLFAVEARVSGVEIDWRHSRMRIHGLTLANPPGYTAPLALEIPQTIVQFRIGSLLGSTPVLESIRPERLKLEFELQLTQSNWADLLNSVLQTPPSQKKYLIREILIEGAELQLRAPLREAQPLVIPLTKIFIENLTPDNAALSLEQAAALVLARLLHDALLQTRERLAQENSRLTNWLIPLLDWILEDWDPVGASLDQE